MAKLPALRSSMATERLRTMMASLLTLLPLLAAGALSSAAAQAPGEQPPAGARLSAGAPPIVVIMPASGTFSSASLAVAIDWIDDAALAPSTRQITLNGVDVTGGFSYGGTNTQASSSGSVILSAGENTLVATICDTAGQCTSRSARYTYEPAPAADSVQAAEAHVEGQTAPEATEPALAEPMLLPPPPGDGDDPPSVRIGPSGGTYRTASRQVRVDFTSGGGGDRSK